MKSLLFLALVLMAYVLLPGCPKPAPTPVKFSIDKPFALQVGQTADCADVLGFTIKFEKVAADSRCPIGDECITAGKADVVLTLTKTSGSQTITLPFTLPNGTSNVTDFKGHTVRVMGVSPMKVKDNEIKPEEYSILLTATVTPSLSNQVRIGEEFTLAVGDSAMMEGDPTRMIRFDSVAGDSRCPEGVKCIWAGRADCKFSLTVKGQAEKVTLTTGDLSQGGQGEAKFDAFLLKITGIAPSKKQVAPMLQKEYKATLVLSQ